MEPVLADGAWIDVAWKRFHWPGDIVAFVDSFGVIRAHRVLGARIFERGMAYVTSGDNAASHDAPVSPSRILGGLVAPASARPRVVTRARAVGKLAAIVLGALRRRVWGGA